MIYLLLFLEENVTSTLTRWLIIICAHRFKRIARWTATIPTQVEKLIKRAICCALKAHRIRALSFLITRVTFLSTTLYRLATRLGTHFAQDESLFLTDLLLAELTRLVVTDALLQFIAACRLLLLLVITTWACFHMLPELLAARLNADNVAFVVRGDLHLTVRERQPVRMMLWLFARRLPTYKLFIRALFFRFAVATGLESKTLLVCCGNTA